MDALGNLVVGGYSQEDVVGLLKTAIWRITPGGTLDPAFNASNGAWFSPDASDGGVQNFAHGIALDAAGNAVAAGQITTTSGNVALWRVTSTGGLDTANFGAGAGFVMQTLTSGGNVANDFGNAVAVDGAGKYVVAGGSASYMALWRYTSAGALDTAAFNATSGFVVSIGAAGGAADVAKAVRLDGSGNLVVAGSSSDANGNRNLAVWRFTDAGIFDNAFGGGVPFVMLGTTGGTFEEGRSIAFDSQGRILVAGESDTSSSVKSMAVWRLTALGALDTTFNAPHGFFGATGAAGGTKDQSFAMALDSKGRIVVAGYSTDANGNRQGTVWRLNGDGTLDTAFHGTGSVVIAGLAGATQSQFRGVAVDAQDRIVAAGFAFDATGAQDMLVCRFIP